VAFKLRYSDVVLSVIRQVLLIYNKLTEVSQVTNRGMFKTLYNNLQSIDKDIVSKILNEICTDLNQVASRKVQLRLFQVYECLNLNRLPVVRSPRSAQL